MLTIRTYRRAVRAWLLSAPGEPSAEDVLAWLRPYKISSKRTMLAALRRWFTYVGGIDPTRTVRVGRPPERVPRAISAEEEDALFDAARSTEDLALLMILRFSGLRVAEAVGARRWVYDAHRQGSRLDLAAGIRIGDLNFTTLAIQVRGKGGSEELAPMDLNTAQVVSRLVGMLPHNHTDAPLFQRSDGTPKGTRWANGRFVLLSRRAKTRRITPHMLRHTFLTRFIEAGGNLRAAQQLARHKKLSSTLIYARFGDRALRSQYDQFAGNQSPGAVR